MSRLIVFDLETTEKYPLGQIFSLAAVVVNEQFEIIDQIKLEVKISKTQIPDPEAVLVTGLDVLAHQQRATLNEREALLSFYDFIDKHRNEERMGSVFLGGQNTSRFDLEFLRSNSLRSGLHPYLSKDVKYVDLLFLSKKLATTNPAFQVMIAVKNTETNQLEYPLNLEHISKSLKITDKKQTHDALDDVLLTLDVFKYYAQEFNLNVFAYQAYEPTSFTPKCGDVFRVLNIENKQYTEKILALHYQDQKYALWLNVSDFDPTRWKKNLVWKTKRNSSMIVSEKVKDLQLKQLASSYLEEDYIANVDLVNFFDEPDCDPELHITGVNYEHMNAVLEFINMGDDLLIETSSNKHTKSFKNMTRFLERFWMLYKNDDTAKTLYKKYLKQRYSGQLKVEKYISNTETTDSKRPSEKYHPALKTRLAQIDQLIETKEEQKDKDLLLKLKSFILDSEVVKTCPELLNE